ncbi:MAG: carbonic anhydrase [Thermoplasmata archaeon]|nr:carbonic anhydrase [Thermoplasmata archaeon]
MPPTILANLAKGQEPFVAILTCSDSRVSPCKIFNLSLGEAFVVRVAGNCATDLAVLGSLEYAVSHLKVKAIVVMGHSDCGAVKASLGCEDRGNLESVMKDLECARSKLPCQRQKDPDAIAEINVMMQMRRLQDFSPAIRSAVQSNKLEIIGAVFDIATGNVRFL